MWRLMHQALSTAAMTVTVLAIPLTLTAQADAQLHDPAMVRRPIPRAALAGSTAFVRTELFFGTAKPDGVPVTDEQFMAFLDAQVTPRFPDGLTLLKADSQFRGEDGDIVKERSFLLILLYPVEDFRVSDRKIEAIRRLYKDTFQQESTLRVDDPLAVRVSF